MAPLPDRSPQALWDTALGQLELQVTRPNFETWLRTSVGLHYADDTFTIGAPSDFAVEWLRTKLAPLIARTVAQVAGRSLTIAFEVIGAPSTPEPAAAVSPPPQPGCPAPNINPNLTFSTFVVVDANRLAYRSARQVATSKAKYNPLLLCGPPGLGKSHLLHAIAEHAHSSGTVVTLLDAEQFVALYGKAVRGGAPQSFRNLFTTCELLLLDDLPYLGSRRGSQEQFFHIFNTLQSSQRRVVLTSDRPPEDIPGLSPHLVSRVQAGLTVDLRLPPSRQRFEIVRTKASALKPVLSESVLRLISRQPYESIRDFEGALNRIAAYADLTHKPPTLESARKALRPLQSPQSQPTAEAVLDIVCQHFSITRDLLSGPSRSRDVTYARHIAMYLLRSLLSNTLNEIGTLLGKRDHSTVLNGYNRILQEINSLPQTRDDIHMLEARLQQPHVS